MLTKRMHWSGSETPVNGLMPCGLTQERLTGGQAAGGETCRLMSSSRGAAVSRQFGLSRVGDLSLAAGRPVRRKRPLCRRAGRRSIRLLG